MQAKIGILGAVLSLCTLAAMAQTKVERLPPDKAPTKVDPLPDDKSRTRVDVLPTEKLTDIPRLDNEPDLNDLLDINFPPEKRPRVANAGMQAQYKPELMGDFRFDRKISYMMRTLEGDLQGYFYFDTRTGTSLKDNQALQRMADEKFPGEMNQIFTTTGAFYQYMKSSETGPVAMKMEVPQNDTYLLLDLYTGSESKNFFNTFKSTGKTPPGAAQGNAVNNIPRSIEYKGRVDGKEVSIYLADPQDVWIDTRYTYHLTGYSGLGYIASPSKRTYMIVGFVSPEGGIWMTRNEKVNYSFSAKGYKPMGNMMAGIENKTAGMHKFAQSSNALDLTNTDLSGMPTNTQMFDMMIKGSEEAVIGIERQIQEATKQKDTREVQRLQCSKACAQKQTDIYKKLKLEYETLWRKYSKDEGKRDEEIGKLMERTMTSIQPCGCN